jgi:hypothetical protein
MEYSLSGRGKMGSLVGASEEIRKTGGIDSSLNEYAVRPNPYSSHATFFISLGAGR